MAESLSRRPTEEDYGACPWREAWSKTHNRPYWFNVNSKESVWEEPPDHAEWKKAYKESLASPTPVPEEPSTKRRKLNDEIPSNMPPLPQTPRFVAVDKISRDMMYIQSVAARRPLPRIFDDINLAIDYEMLRSKQVRRIQNELSRMCREAGTRDPGAALTRWILVRKALEANPAEFSLSPPWDVLLPYRSQVDDGLYWELQTTLRLPPAVSGRICEELSYMSTTAVDYMISYASKLFAINPTPEKPLEAVDDASPAPAAAAVFVPKFSVDKSDPHKVSLTYAERRMMINIAHYNKLKNLFDQSALESERGDEAKFQGRLLQMLIRYDALGGAGYQAACPRAVFRLIEDKLGVSHECFASPFNCTLPSFCSAFEDTDCDFGSKGSFFRFPVTGGSFEANPPFVEESMYAMALRIDELLRTCEAPLSFFVVVPGWDDTNSYFSMKYSKFLRQFATLHKSEHVYQDGAQHRSQQEHRIAECTTFIFVLQNDAGAQKWPCTEEVMKEILETWRNAEPI